MKRITLIVTALLVSATTAAEDGASENLVEGREVLATYLQDTQSLQAQFRSVLMDGNGRTLQVSEGDLAVKKPRRFRWAYRVPDETLLIADGERLWNFDPDLEQAVVSQLDDLRSAGASFLLGADTQLEKDFEVTGSYRTGEVFWVALAPVDEAVDFASVRLGFVEDHVALMELRDKLQQTTQIEFTDVVVNGDVADNLFAFTPPPGVDVIGAQELGATTN